MINQCSSCGGFCKKSGCERENVKPTPQRTWVGLTDEEVKNIGCLGMPVNVPVTPPQRTWAGLTDEEIEQVRLAIMGVAYWCADENMPEAYNARKVCCAHVLGILVKAQEKNT